MEIDLEILVSTFPHDWYGLSELFSLLLFIQSDFPQYVGRGTKLFARPSTFL